MDKSGHNCKLCIKEPVYIQFPKFTVWFDLLIIVSWVPHTLGQHFELLITIEKEIDILLAKVTKYCAVHDDGH